MSQEHNVYESPHRNYVVTFLTRKYGYEIGNRVYNDKSVSVDDVLNIQKYVLPKPPKPTPDIDFQNERVQLDSIRYLVRTYGDTEGRRKWMEKEMSLIDKKMIYSMGKLYDKYNQSSLERQVINKTDFIQPELKNNLIKEDVKCKAFKMNGEQCTAKAKTKGLCLRHSKRV